MASICHLVMHLPFGDGATRHASRKQCSKCSFGSVWFNVVLIKVDAFTISDTMESMKGHKNTGNQGEQM